MNRLILIFILPFLFIIQLFGQDSILAPGEIVIKETVTIIDKSNLFPGWKNFIADTIDPTSIANDFNGDGKLDIAGLFSGIESGFFIIGNVNGGDYAIEKLFKLDFDSSWYDKDKFQAVISLVKSGKRIKNIQTGSLLTLSHNSVEISKRNGSQYIVTFKDDEWKTIIIK